jgi:acetyl esterase/lipase
LARADRWTRRPLLDDARRLAVRASDAEVDVVLDITAKVPHVFQSFAGMLDEADEALDRAALFLRQRVRGAATAVRIATPRVPAQV